MSDRDRHPHGPHEDLAAYALGALEPAEAERFRRHLQTCAVCRSELEALQGVVDALPLSAPGHAASPELRRSVRRAIAQEPHPSDRSRRARRPRAPVRLPRGWLVGGMACALVIVTLVIVLATGGGAGSSTRVIHARVSGAGTATLRLGDGRAELVVHDFPAPPPGKIYEVWLVRGDRAPAPTNALFGVRAGNGDVEVPGSLAGVTRVLVTPEPAGGSRVPTHAPVIAATID